jgi:hypothetical protein
MLSRLTHRAPPQPRGPCPSARRHPPGTRRRAAPRTAATSVETSFLNGRGERLAGTIMWPAAAPAAGGGAAPAGGGAADRGAGGSTGGGGTPAAILAHGYMGGRGSELLVRIATALAKEGVA